MLNRDGTASFGDMDSETNKYTPGVELKYTFNTKKKQIYIRVEKILFSMDDEDEKWCTYEETISLVNEYFTIKNTRKRLQEEFEREKDTENFKEDYPDCDTYEKYEAAVIKNPFNFKSFEDYVDYLKTTNLSIQKHSFSPLVTYDYKDENKALTLTEKFTGIGNLLNSNCQYENETDDNYAYFAGFYAGYGNSSSDYVSYSIDTSKNEIEFFEMEDVYKKFKATYTEDIANGTATMTVNGKKYLCKFTGNTYTQE